MRWFGVALWRVWEPSALAYADVYVLAPSAFVAIETVMQAYQVEYVAYAAADLVGGSLHYRAYKVRVALDPYVVLEALSWVSEVCSVQANVCHGNVPLRVGNSVCAVEGRRCESVEVACYP